MNEGGGEVRKEYEQLAPVYDVRWSSYVAAAADETLKRVTEVPGARVLDAGCGTGAILARLACWEDARLIGIDPSTGMLEQARAKLPARIGLVAGWAERMPFADEVFDLVISSSVLHYIRNPERALLEMNRVLAPGGRIVITDWCRNFWTMRLAEVYFRIFHRAHHWTHTEQECASLLGGAGFDQVEIARYRINWFWGLMTAGGIKPKRSGI